MGGNLAQDKLELAEIGVTVDKTFNESERTLQMQKTLQMTMQLIKLLNANAIFEDDGVFFKGDLMINVFRQLGANDDQKTATATIHRTDPYEYVRTPWFV